MFLLSCFFTFLKIIFVSKDFNSVTILLLYRSYLHPINLPYGTLGPEGEWHIDTDLHYGTMTLTYWVLPPKETIGCPAVRASMRFGQQNLFPLMFPTQPHDRRRGEQKKANSSPNHMQISIRGFLVGVRSLSTQFTHSLSRWALG